MPRLLKLTLLSFVFATVCGCGSKIATEDATKPTGSATTSSTEKGTAQSGHQFDTPEAVYAALAEATKNNDYGTVASFLTEETQTMLAGGLLFGSGFATMGDANKEEELTALLGKHGIDVDAEEEPPTDLANADPEAMMKEMTAPIKDVPAFIGEMLAWLDKNTDGPSSGFPDMGELGEVTIDGDSAKAISQTDGGPQPIEFHKVGGSWLAHMPIGGPGGDMAADLDAPEEEIEDDGTPGLGTFWYGDKTIKLRHALAYKSKFFDDPCTVVLLTDRPINERDMNNLKKVLQEQGSDEAFFFRHPHIKLSLDAEGKPIFMFAWIDNMSINSNSGIDTDIQIEGNRVHGTAAMTEAEEIADTEYRFEATFDIELMPSE